MDNTSTGELIAEQRKALGMTQKELAEKLNITDKAVSKWETGKSAPDTGNLIPLADILGVSVVELLNGSKIKDEGIEEATVKAVEKTIENTKKKYFKNFLIVISVIAITVSGIYNFLYWYWGRRHQILYDVDKIYLSENENGDFDYRITGTARNWIINRNHLYYFCFYSDNPGMSDYNHYGCSDYFRVEKNKKTEFEIKGTVYANFKEYLTEQEAKQYVYELRFSAMTGNPWDTNDWNNGKNEYIEGADLYMSDFPSAELITE